MGRRTAVCLRLLLALCVSISAGVPCVACGGSGHEATSAARIPPAEEPPWTKAATVTPDAGAAGRDSEVGPANSSSETPANSSTETPNER